jgi:hypothetical protein
MNTSGAIVVLVVAALFLVCTPSEARPRRYPAHRPAARTAVSGPVRYPNPKLPEGTMRACAVLCSTVPLVRYSLVVTGRVLLIGNTTVFAIAEQDDFVHVFALGKDGALYHK